MKCGIALLLLVVVAGLAECRPNENLQQRVAELRAKGKGKGGERKDGKGKGKDTDWPYGWIEFASLLGKCEAARNWFEILEMDMETSDEGVLSHACPKTYECAENLLNATEEELKEVTKFMNEVFPLLQCANLQADKEALGFALMVNGKNITEDIYMKETEELFNVCYKLFESVEGEVEELDKDMEKIEEIEENATEEATRDAKIKSLLRQLINTAAKKR
ncbi:uncharacterized protein LOC123545635 [Mercenaria mercenaria]|uniref:uncharacterized protein LOC123545635 n=1 Tax=Mercenaria mercenaria TaxID=6596 RepID=UPI00234E8512|nr:uncharacterized protein LOC123545635 [Mercenaria mercenaria]